MASDSMDDVLSQSCSASQAVQAQRQPRGCTQNAGILPMPGARMELGPVGANEPSSSCFAHERRMVPPFILASRLGGASEPADPRPADERENKSILI
jgi:hypothetical protein